MDSSFEVGQAGVPRGGLKLRAGAVQAGALTRAGQHVLSGALRRTRQVCTQVNAVAHLVLVMASLT